MTGLRGYIFDKDGTLTDLQARWAFVGDSHQDQRCAVAAGMRFVAVGDLGPGPDGPPDGAIADIVGLL